MWPRNMLHSTAIILCVILLWLAGSRELILYVHPRYVVFTVVLASISLLILLIAKFSANGTKKTVGLLMIISTVLAAYFAPTTLSERTASTRSQASQNTNSQLQPTTYSVFNDDYTHFDIQDWTTYLATQPPIGQISNKQASITGFIYIDQGQRYIARFKVSCCAVDASPLSIAVADGSVANGLQEGKWYILDGSFERSTGQVDYALKIKKVVQIIEPLEPYVY